VGDIKVYDLALIGNSATAHFGVVCGWSIFIYLLFVYSSLSVLDREDVSYSKAMYFILGHKWFIYIPKEERSIAVILY
jgi:hypothetical protein